MNTREDDPRGGQQSTDEASSCPPPCIRCGKQLEPVHPDLPTQPYAGTTFRSFGQYGSTVFDQGPRARTHLEITVCDACLRELGPLGYIWLVTPAVCHHDPTHVPWKPWEPEDDEG